MSGAIETCKDCDGTGKILGQDGTRHELCETCGGNSTLGLGEPRPKRQERQATEVAEALEEAGEKTHAAARSASRSKSKATAKADADS